MGKDIQAIYLDQNGVNIIRGLLEEKMNQLSTLAKFSDSYKSVLNEIANLRNYLERAVIQDRNDEVVNIDDLVELVFDEDDEPEIVKIVAGRGNSLAKIKEVSISSPLGEAIHHKPYGTECSYQVNGNEVPVFIKSKVILDEEMGTQTR